MFCFRLQLHYSSSVFMILVCGSNAFAWVFKGPWHSRILWNGNFQCKKVVCRHLDLPQVSHAGERKKEKSERALFPSSVSSARETCGKSSRHLAVCLGCFLNVKLRSNDATSHPTFHLTFQPTFHPTFTGAPTWVVKRSNISPNISPNILWTCFFCDTLAVGAF